MYIGLFEISGSIKKIFSIECEYIYFSQSVVLAKIYLFSILFSIGFEKSGVIPHCLPWLKAMT